MSATHATAGPWFGGRGDRFGLGPAAWMAMAAGRGRRGGPGPFRGGPRGGFPFGGPPFGGPPFGRPPFPRRPKVRRGDVRAAALALLAEQPRNGYQIIQELAERSGGVWRPSPGSVYPALQQLEDEGLVRVEEREGRRVFVLTEEGRAYVDAHQDELTAPWETVSDTMDDGMLELRDVSMQVAAAVMQVAHAGTDAQIAEARKVLADTRRALYRILAEGEPGSDDPADPAPGDTPDS